VVHRAPSLACGSLASAHTESAFPRILRNLLVLHQRLLRVVNDCKAIIPVAGRYLQAVKLLLLSFKRIIGAWLAWILVRECCTLRAIEPFQANLRGDSIASVAIVTLSI
jgi:hypothetical protein